MFGDMFKEPEGPVQGCMPKPSTDNGTRFEAPPPLRGQTGFCGIKNQGATCYLNSLIQTLLLTPEFREELFCLGPDELGKLDDVKKKNAKVRIIPIQLQMLLARLLLLKQYACGTEGLTESFGWVDNEELQQHDVQELSRILFCAIEDSLVGTSGHEIIKNLYRGVIANTITCLNCKKVSERPEDFLDLNIAIAAQSSLTAVLRDMFVETELMSGKNQYHCGNCAKLVDAKKGAIIKTLPPILTVSLLRFSFDYNTLRRYKETRKFDFPLTLNMRQYCENGKNKCHEYDLYSIIIHSGGAHGGHYHAYIRDVDGLGTVPHDYDPTPPKPTPPSENLETDYIENPLEMVAAILGKLGGENVPLHKLGEAFRDESGTSWSKLYKRKYGTMIKFLQGNYETFMVDTRTKTVSFRTRNLQCDQASADTSVCSSDISYIGFETGDGIPRTSEPSSLVNGVDSSIETIGEQAASGEPQDDGQYHPLCNVWFDFNDSHIKAITTHDIETLFEGRECAYMLFYRRKDLKRPMISLGDALNSIPDHILAQMQKENSDLESLRLEYDIYLNVVTVQVYFPSMLKFEDGLVKLRQNDNGVVETGFSYSIDRRKTIADMTSDLLQMAEKHTETDLIRHKVNLQCNIMKVLDHQGVHIYEQIDSDKNNLINDSILVNDQKILLWNGISIQDKKIRPGRENEPKILNIRCQVDGDPEISCVHYKGVSDGNISIEVLKQYFLDKFKLWDVISSSVFVVDHTETPEKVENHEVKVSDVVSSCEGNITIKIHLTNEEIDIHEDRSGDILTVNIALTENLDKMLTDTGVFSNFEESFILLSMSCVVRVYSYIFVEHLKSKIPRWLFPHNLSKFKQESINLCIDNVDTVGSLALGKLSLHEQQSLASAGLSTSATVKLDVGPPLGKNLMHVVVYVQKGAKLKFPIKKSQFVKFDCIKTRKVTSLIEAIVSQLNLVRDAYHLRILKSDKELGDIIMNPNMAIDKTVIHHGCAMVLCPGDVSSEGLLRVPILFYRDLISFDKLRARICTEKDLTPWSQIIDDKEIHPVSIGHVAINKDSTIFDLKQEVCDLEYFKGHEWTPEDICLRSVNHKFPTKFHLQEGALIKRLRLGVNSPLAVSSKNCIPQDGYTSLHLSFNIPGTRIYANDCELQWEKLTSFSQFPAKVAEIFDLTVKDVLIARRGEEPWEWEIVKSRDSDAKDKTTLKGKRNSKQKKVPTKSKTKKPSIKICALLQDGDVIRVKRIIPNLINVPDVTDFRSDDDLAAYKKWYDSRHKESSAPAKTKGHETITKKSIPKREETLHIHVDKF